MMASGIAMDSSGNAYVTGRHLFDQFSATTNAYQNHLACTNSVYFNANAFVTEIAAGRHEFGLFNLPWRHEF